MNDPALQKALAYDDDSPISQAAYILVELAKRIPGIRIREDRDLYDVREAVRRLQAVLRRAQVPPS